MIIGRRIDALEKRLGVRLMHRSTRRLALTEEGDVYLEHCRELLADLGSRRKPISRAGTRRPAI